VGFAERLLFFSTVGFSPLLYTLFIYRTFTMKSSDFVILYGSKKRDMTELFDEYQSHNTTNLT
jgi:hypothetical protein